MTDRDPFVEEREMMIKQINTEISGLERELSSASEKRSAVINDKLFKLKLQRKELKDQIAQARDTKDNAWGDLQEGLDIAFEKIKNSIKK